MKDLATRFRVCVATIWRWSKESPEFPKPVKVCGSTGWRRADLETYELGLETL
ncbi:MAG: AlpA family phage regulatory protein [Devosia sp.]|nr:AlpA family phage regulatory protein [Devosia sp.]